MAARRAPRAGRVGLQRKALIRVPEQVSALAEAWGRGRAWDLVRALVPGMAEGRWGRVAAAEHGRR